MERLNLDPEIWGSKAWFFLESIAISYPANPTMQEMDSAKKLIYSLKDLLPCYKCRINYTTFINENPLNDYYLATRDNLLEYIVKIHNHVNIINNKKVLSMDDVINYYKSIYNCSYINLYYIIFIIIILSVVYLVYSNVKCRKYEEINTSFY